MSLPLHRGHGKQAANNHLERQAKTERQVVCSHQILPQASQSNSVRDALLWHMHCDVELCRYACMRRVCGFLQLTSVSLP